MPTTVTKQPSLTSLYESDETAWLDAMAELAAQGRYAEMDLPNLSEYLTSMAKRDRREVFSRLVVLLVHLLKWERQPEKRSGSWQACIMEQRRELRVIVESGTLHNHALAVLAAAFAHARKQAAAETELPIERIPIQCPWELDRLLVDDESDR